jgi:molybdopterin-guanine dinucleotide biosynthesis protein A
MTYSSKKLSNGHWQSGQAGSVYQVGAAVKSSMNKTMFSIVIQAGGASRRMGQDKALIPFLGQPLITRIIQRVSGLADELLVNTNRPDAYAFLGLPTFPDVIPERGALGGVYTALAIAKHPLVAVVACDMPFVNPDLLVAQRALLVDIGYDAVIPVTDHGAEPFHAVYRRDTCLPFVKAALDAGNWRVNSWFENANLYFLPPEEARQHDPLQLAFRNVNMPADLRAAEQLAKDIG